MARRSNRLESELCVSDNNHRIGIYARVSVDNNESESIENQIMMANSFVKERINNRSIIKYYIDRGVSGYTFERKEIKRLIHDIKNYKINCIVVKDLSRLGRNYLAVERFVSEFIYQYDVRLISIIDNYDSYTAEDNQLFNITIKNMFNEMYIRDVGRKIKKSKEFMIKRGRYVGIYAPYGYIKKKELDYDIDESISGLYIDKKVEWVVKMIFDKYIEHKSINNIIEILCRMKIATKGHYRQKGMVFYTGVVSKWNYKSIRDMLTNEVYIGNVVQNKTKRIYGENKIIRININEKEYIKVMNTHEGIISHEDFFLVKKMMEEGS